MTSPLLHPPSLLSWKMGINGEMFQLLSVTHSELNEGLQFCQTEMEVVCREENVHEFLIYSFFLEISFPLRNSVAFCCNCETTASVIFCLCFLQSFT